MKRSVSLKWSNLWVGALLMFVIAIILWASFTGGGTSIFEHKKKFKCYFPNVEGLVVGSPIWMSGIEVGNVRKLRFVYLDSVRQVEVICAVVNSVWPRITSEAEISIGSIGFLGDRYLELHPAIGRGKPIKEMDVIRVRDVGSAQAVFKQAERAAAKAGDLAGNLDTLLARMNRGEGTLGKLATDKELYQQLTALLAKMTVLTADLQNNQERIVSSLENVSSAVKSLSDQVNNNTGTMGRIMTDPALYDNLATTTAKLDTILLKINTAEGSMGMLVNDTALYSEITTLVTKTNNLIDDIQKNPRKYFRFSVF
ncbi:MAG: MCE family protein [Candidatus Zixiibacteriota bacterium]|nr:MAG: MCE family protein [candidate division Zixibacteria bacterium]